MHFMISKTCANITITPRINNITNTIYKNPSSLILGFRAPLNEITAKIIRAIPTTNQTTEVAISQLIYLLHNV